MEISAHDDVDGQSSVAQLIISGNYTEKNLKFQEKFGEFTEKTELMLDSYNLEFPGTIIDHHGSYFDVKNAIENKIAKCKNWNWIPSCTSLGIFQKYQKEIPKEFFYLHILGATADGVPHLISFDIWKKYSFLYKEKMIYPSGAHGTFKQMKKSIPIIWWLCKFFNTGRYIRNPYKSLDFMLKYDLEDILLSSTNELDAWRETIYAVDNSLTSTAMNSIIRKSPNPRIINDVFLWCIKTKISEKFPPLKIHSRICSQIFGKKEKLSLNNVKIFIVVNLDSPGEILEASARCDYGIDLVNFLNNILKKDIGVFHHSTAIGFDIKKSELKNFVLNLQSLKRGKSNEYFKF